MLQRYFRAHQILAKRLLKKAEQTKTQQYGTFLTRLFVKKPKHVIQLLRKRRDGPASVAQTSLTVVQDTTGQLHTAPAAVIRCVENLAREALSPSPTVNPTAPFPWAAEIKAPHQLNFANIDLLILFVLHLLVHQYFGG